MSNSDWDKKRTEDAHRASIPYGLRYQMEQDAEKEKEKQKKEKEKKEKDEAITGNVFQIPVGMYQGRESGNEQEDSIVVPTPPDVSNGHTHTATIDYSGNGDTSVDGETPHSHNVRSFIVAPYSHNGYVSVHRGTVKPEEPETAGYTGEVGAI